MRIQWSRRRYVVFPLAALGLLTSLTNAQSDLPGLTDLSFVTTGGRPSTTTTTNVASTTTGPSPSTTTQTTKPSTTAQSDSSTNSQPTTKTAQTTRTDASPTTTEQPSSTTTTTTTPSPNPTTAPSQSTPSSSTSILQILTGTLPTILGATIPTPIVPDTSLAPFMQKSSLPEGTVFIAVGAILGFLGMSILAWRGLVAWSLHRSVRRAAGPTHHHPPHHLHGFSSKGKLGGGGGAGFYHATGAGSSMSLDHLGAGTGGKDTHSGPPSGRNSLFFSPTAGAGLHSSGFGGAGSNRSSSYFPAGYYPTGSAAPAGGNSTTYVGGGGIGTSPLANLSGLTMGPQSAGYMRTAATPPESPGLYPGYRGSRRGSYVAIDGQGHNPVDSRGKVPVGGGNLGVARPGGMYPETGSVTGSTSTVSLMGPSSTVGTVGQVHMYGQAGQGQGHRAPSAYLEDLFEHHGNGMNR